MKMMLTVLLKLSQGPQKDKRRVLKQKKRETERKENLIKKKNLVEVKIIVIIHPKFKTIIFYNFRMVHLSNPIMIGIMVFILY